MAKKKNDLTLEEKLQNALIPEEEQPYPIPDNWVWTIWGNVGTFIAGSAFRKDLQGYSEYDIPFYKVGSLKYSNSNGELYDLTNTINEKTRLNIKAELIPNHSIIFAKIGEAIKLNRRAFNQNPCCIDNNLIAFKSLKSDYRYVFYWSKTLELYSYTNATTVPAIRKSDLEKICIPLPPILEQQRIVNRIEILFSKLDEAKEKIQLALDSFENRKSAILYQAFSGELTKKWREENGISLDDWEESTIGNYAITKYGYTKSANFMEVGPKYLRITDIKNGKVDWNMVPYCDITEENYRKYKLKKFDIVVARTGATTGKSYLILNDVKAVYASYLIKIEIDNVELLNPKFLYLFLQTQSYWNQITDLSSGIAQPGVNANKLKTINITVPPLEEQKEIVRILDIIFEKEQDTEELIGLIEKIDLMKKSILARAFRGELGTNIPEEESAIELLKSVLEAEQLV